MSDFDAMFKEIVRHAFKGHDDDEIEQDLIGFNRMLDRIAMWKESPVLDDRDFARWLQLAMIRNLAGK